MSWPYLSAVVGMTGKALTISPYPCQETVRKEGESPREQKRVTRFQHVLSPSLF